MSSLSEDSPSRRALDDAWAVTGEYLLARGLWNFALRSVELSADEDVEPRFGFTYAFSKPEDWVRTANISDSQDIGQGFEDFEDEPGVWYANVDTLYVRYVSNDDAYGWNVGAWRQPFARAFEAQLAFDCGLPISGDKSNRNDMHVLAEKLLKQAKTLDAVDERVRFSPPGRLVRSRVGRHSRENR